MESQVLQTLWRFLKLREGALEDLRDYVAEESVADALWNCAVMMVVMTITCAICTHIVLKNSGKPVQNAPVFDSEQKRALRELLLKTNTPTDEEISSLLRQEAFREKCFTRTQIRWWFKQTNTALVNLALQAVKEREGGRAARCDANPTQGHGEITNSAGKITRIIPRGTVQDSKIVMQGGKITVQGAKITSPSGEITDAAAGEITRTAPKITSTAGEITSILERGGLVTCSSLRAGRVTIRGIEVAQRCKDS